MLTVGDVVIIEDGDYVPADIRLFETVNLKVEESGLTGESLAVEKMTEKIDGTVGIGDRKNTAFSSSLVTYGRGKGYVIAVGMETEVGKIAQMINEVQDKQTPLKKKLNSLGKTLAFLASIICVIIFFIGISTGKSVLSMLITAISLAVAAIPEGLPAVATIVQAMGVKKLVSKNAIVKKMPAVETLGSATIICSDKTGTLTQNKMTVVDTYVVEKDNEEQFLNTLLLCNNAKLVTEEDGKDIGDPTETALLRHVYDKDNKEYFEKLEKYERIYEIPFDSAKKYMVSVNKVNGKIYGYIKGGIDEVYNNCKIDENTIKTLKEQNIVMAEKALRVLACGYFKITEKYNNEKELEKIIESALNDRKFEIIGIVGMIDPPRKEAKEAIEKCSNAGILTIMITGDHVLTATAIAKELRNIKKWKNYYGRNRT